MAFQKTKLTDVISVTGIATVGIFTAGQTSTPAGIAGTSYVKSVLMHNTGIGSITSSLYFYPTGQNLAAHGNTSFRMARVDLAENETFFFETNYPIVLGNQDKIVVEVTQSGVGGAGIGSAINYQILGDTDI